MFHNSPRARLGVLLLSALSTSCGQETRTVNATYDDGSKRGVVVERQDETGEWSEHGEAQLWYPADGQLKAKGAYVDGAQEGTWTLWYPNGVKLAEGKYRAGRKQGPWTSWYPDGTVKEHGALLSDKAEGVWVYRNPDGTVEPVQSGLYEDGVKIDDWFIDGLRILSFSDDSPREEAFWKDGVRHGASTSYHHGGRRASEGHYDAGQRTGPWEFWDADGTLNEERSGNYAKGKRLGDVR